MVLSPLLPDLRRHAEACFPQECCGLIVRGASGLAVRPGRNLLDSSDHFELDPATLVASRRRGESLAALYHSHCDGPARLSIADRAAATLDEGPAWPGVELVVLAVHRGRLTEWSRYAWCAARGDFAPTPWDDPTHDSLVPVRCAHERSPAT